MYSCVSVDTYHNSIHIYMHAYMHTHVAAKRTNCALRTPSGQPWGRMMYMTTMTLLVFCLLSPLSHPRPPLLFSRTPRHQQQSCHRHQYHHLTTHLSSYKHPSRVGTKGHRITHPPHTSLHQTRLCLCLPRLHQHRRHRQLQQT